MAKDLNEIRIKIKTSYGEKIFIFKMNRHFDGNDQTVMKTIAEWIANNADSPDWLQGPLWMILNVRIAHITPGHALWNLLDQDARSSPTRNYLMWDGHVKFNDTIVVTHFGPLGLGQEKRMKNEFNDYDQKFWNDMLRNLGIRSLRDLDKKSKKDREEDEKAMKDLIDKQYLKIRQEKCDAIEIAKAVLLEVIKSIFGALEEGAEVTAMLAKSLAPTAAKLLLKELTPIVLKQVAKEIAAISAKQGGKSFAKKIPVAGFFVGVGLGAWRVAQGDPGRAAMEVASGAASCVPGPGTATSVALDVAIAGIDIAEAIEKYNAKRALFLRHTSELEKMWSEVDELENAYRRITAAYKEFDFGEDGEKFIKAIKYIPW
ncbi:uncharacterized protein LOC135486423 [Lineus longissimus]|uniref:uncharacterized protein LOC135486423 n=1 Tax=Lineus longissimus TaxID=88925 RepID=UPI002B4DD407